MPRKAKQTAHAELDELRQRAVAERVKARDVEAQLEAAKAQVDDASARIADGYAAEDQRAVTSARKAEEQAVAEVRDLQHRLTGAEIRVERAQQQVDNFQRERAEVLLQERERAARTIAAELTASVHETVRLARAYLSECTAQDALVAAVPGATPRTDGPAATHPWEAQLKALERAVAEVPEIPAPLPRWQGLQHRQQQDNANRIERRRRSGNPPVDDEAALASGRAETIK